jgi:para-aminobenzoate synthetase / 4-amino-4-deoxychorismate lyase
VPDPRLALPFALLDDAQRNVTTLLSGLAETIRADRPEEVAPAVARLEAEGGREAAGFIAYEAGWALQPKLAERAAPLPDGLPLLWLGFFERAERVDAASLLPDPAGAWAGPACPQIERAAYDGALDRLHEHILDGDIYQANYTFPAHVPVAGHPLALYAAIRRRARAPHQALLFTGEHWILSFSPELFFTLKQGRVTTKPMKGTATRGRDPKADQAAVAELASDPKQRAENLMIVDLLRNDLSRVAQTGTVKVPKLFDVETYPTVHQLVSTVTAQLEEKRGVADLIRALFPCGSITGAPKIRAMEIIAEQEIAPRGVYCGALGWVRPSGDASFNVAIRTLTLREGDAVARLGLGSGIVADSRTPDEWRECLAKGAFVATERPFDLIETMRHHPHDGLFELERHLARMKASADALGFRFSRHDARNELQAATFGAGERLVRLRLARSGAMAIETQPLPGKAAVPVAVAVAPLPVDRRDFRLRHKTSDRAFYDSARAQAGTFEVIFADPDGFLTEGSFTNLFVPRGELLLTPPLSRGLLPGVLRQSLIETGRAVEQDLRMDDLRDGFLIGNAVRGLLPARLA